MRAEWQDRSLLGLAVALGVLSFLLLRDLWTGVILGGLTGYFAWPLHRRVTRRLKRPRIVAFLIVAAGFFAFALPVMAFIGVFALDAVSFAEGFDARKLDAAAEGGRQWIYASVGLEPPAGNITLTAEVIPRLVDAMLPFLKNVATTTTKVAFMLGIAGFTTYYALVDGPRGAAWVLDHSPLGPERTGVLFAEVRRVIEAVFYGQVVAAVAQGALGGVMFWALGIPWPLFWTAVMAILSFLPIVGAFLVWLPASLWLYLEGEPTRAVIMFLWGAIVVSQVDNFIKPRLIGDRAGIHPLLVLLGVFGGLSTFGFLGFLLGPLVIALFLASLRAVRAIGMRPAAVPE